MGIIILPFLLGAIGLSIFAIVNVIKLFRMKMINIKDILKGFLISSSIFGLICFSYLLEGSAWALSPAFRIPIFMVFLPYIIYFLYKASNKPTLKYLSTLMLISIGVTGIFAVVLIGLNFELLNFLNVEQHF